MRKQLKVAETGPPASHVYFLKLLFLTALVSDMSLRDHISLTKLWALRISQFFHRLLSKTKRSTRNQRKGEKLLFIWPCWTQEILTFSWEIYMGRFQDYKDSENSLNLRRLCQRNLNLWHVTINDTCQIS